MKTAAFILAFLVLLCSGTSCCAMNDCNDEIAGQHTNSRQDDDCKGNCSPFFACGACAGFSANIHEVELKPVTVTINTSYPEYRISSHSDHIISFWQPPKIS